MREVWMWESGKDECVRTDVGPGYDFPGRIEARDGSEGNGSMGAGFIVLGKSVVTGSIRVGQETTSVSNIVEDDSGEEEDK